MQIAEHELDVTEDQKEALRLIKMALAENGYAISDVPEGRRRSEWDFIAADRNAPRMFMRVRPTPKGHVAITGFNLPAHYPRARRRIATLRSRLPTRVVWSRKRLSFHKHKPDWWKDYFPPGALEPFGLSGL